MLCTKAGPRDWDDIQMYSKGKRVKREMGGKQNSVSVSGRKSCLMSKASVIHEGSRIVQRQLGVQPFTKSPELLIVEPGLHYSLASTFLPPASFLLLWAGFPSTYRFLVQRKTKPFFCKIPQHIKYPLRKQHTYFPLPLKVWYNALSTDTVLLIHTNTPCFSLWQDRWSIECQEGLQKARPTLWYVHMGKICVAAMKSLSSHLITTNPLGRKSCE